MINYTDPIQITGMEDPLRIDTSADGRWLAVTSFDNKLRLYDAHTFEVVKTVHLGTSFPLLLKFTTDSSKLVAGGKNPSVFDLSPSPKDGLPLMKKLASLSKFKQDPQNCTQDHDGLHLWTVGGEDYTPTDHFIRKWNLETGELKEKWKLDNVTEGIAISKSGLWLVISQSNGDIKMFELATGREIWEYRSGKLSTTSVAFSNDDSTVYIGVSSLLGGTLEIYALRSDIGELIQPMLNLPFEKYSVNQLTVMKSGNLLLSLFFQREDKSMVLIVDPVSGEIIWQSKKYERWNGRHTLSPDEKYIYCTWSEPDQILIFKAGN